MGKFICFIIGLGLFWLGHQFNLVCDPTDPNSCTLCGPGMYFLGVCVIVAPWLGGNNKTKNDGR